MEVNYRYNFKNELIIKDIIEYIREFDYGTMVNYSDIAKRIGLNLDTEDGLRLFRNIMAKVRNILIDYSYVLKSVGGKGYYILKPNQIASFTYRTYIIKPKKAYIKAQKILEKTDKSNFKPMDHNEHRDLAELNKDLLELTNDTIYDSNYYHNRGVYIKNDYERSIEHRNNKKTS